jgi:hypothetical protein
MIGLATQKTSAVTLRFRFSFESCHIGAAGLPPTLQVLDEWLERR